MNLLKPAIILLSILIIPIFASGTDILSVDETSSYVVNCGDISYDTCKEVLRVNPKDARISKRSLKDFESLGERLYEDNYIILLINFKKNPGPLKIPDSYILQLRTDLINAKIHPYYFKAECGPYSECYFWENSTEHDMESFTVELMGQVLRPIIPSKDSSEIFTEQENIRGEGFGRKITSAVELNIYEGIKKTGEKMVPGPTIQKVYNLNAEVTNKKIEECFEEIEKNCNLTELENLSKYYPDLIKNLNTKCDLIKKVSEDGRPGWAAILSRNVKRIKEAALNITIPCPEAEECLKPCNEAEECRPECKIPPCPFPWLFVIISIAAGAAIAWLLKPEDRSEELKLKKKLIEVNDELNKKKDEINKVANEISSKDTNASVKLKGISNNIDRLKDIIR